MAGRLPLFETPEELEDMAMEFINKCVDDKLPMTISGLALHLGFCSRQSFYDYEDKPLFTYTIKRLRLMIETSYEAALRTDRSPTGAIFALKNFGWIDKQEIKHEGSAITIQVGDNKAKDGLDDLAGEVHE